MALPDTPRTVPISFYRSSPAPCPYLDGRIERKLFARLEGPAAADINADLTHAGFRRSMDIIYRPACPSCAACRPVRLPLATFTPHGSLAKTARRTDPYTFAPLPEVTALPSHYQLFKAYQTVRHAGGEMAEMTFDDYAAMIANTTGSTHLFTLTAPDGRLMGAMLADQIGAAGWSAVYSFYDVTPEATPLSLGSALILKMAAYAKAHGADYLYLGYYVQGSAKMGYKARFSPLQQLSQSGAWVAA